jgi:phosphoenolpyruvate---glycerone phosphotransferase subunit DhaM
MVAILVVSHSRKLAEGVSELVGQIASTDAVRAVGGTEDGRLGTSADSVQGALEDLSSADGVVIIPDLGSAVLTVRTVLGEHPRDDVVLVDAPFVEGAVAAAVIAASGASLEEVTQAAREARDVPKL